MYQQIIPTFESNSGNENQLIPTVESNSGNENQLSTMVKAWYLTPNKKNIQVIDIPKQPGLEFFYDLLNCDGVEYLGFTDEKQNSYGIYMDEMGAFKNNPVNKCAKNLLRRIQKINWGEFDGWYIIFLSMTITMKTRTNLTWILLLRSLLINLTELCQSDSPKPPYFLLFMTSK